MAVAVPPRLRQQLAAHWRIEDGLDAGQVVGAVRGRPASSDRTPGHRFPIVVKPPAGAGAKSTFSPARKAPSATNPVRRRLNRPWSCLGHSSGRTPEDYGCLLPQEPTAHGQRDSG